MWKNKAAATTAAALALLLSSTMPAWAVAVPLVVYGVGLAHRVAAVRHEVEVTLGRAEEARAPVAQLSLPGRA